MLTRTLSQLEKSSLGNRTEKTRDHLISNFVLGGVCGHHSDDDRFYRTVMVKENPFTTGFNFLVSNPVQGSVPPQMKVVSQHAVFKQMRDMNAFQSLEAFPYRGAVRDPQSATGDGLVTQQHKDLLKRNGQ